ncbi:hypothetical protein A3715_06500 [Oleiphilus sp. HI0009]|nr:MULTISPECIES: DUF2860 family protein [unclassified Oleiphilus]KZX82159.1 hypothetical protein A3715_06500 [Oleiphilus sp. HI0009]KZY71252.1 hypothetical protein A3739_05330 [Oleiphilus sp. HI0067]KZY72273.1 hypothetical protein A3738_03150 [Oleiphilus sp. HI0066]KZZ58774.1 hypothetical protein A3762_07235 [Oleiphilus sp. HI0125]
MNHVYSAIALIGSFAFSTLLHSAPLKPIPKESGFSGSVVGGASAVEYSSNLVAGTSGKLSDQTIKSINADPETESSVAPFITGEVNYTFAESRTQAYLGVALEDLVRYDLAFQLGVKQELSKKGIVYGAFLFSALPTEVYADPYVANVARARTDRSSTGARLGWQNVLGTGLGLEVSSREIELDEENAGADLVTNNVITADEQTLLNREGTQTEVTVSYLFRISKGHLVVPELNFDRFDLDGKARARDRMGATLAYFHTRSTWSFVGTLFYSSSDYDELNPIYGKKEEVDTIGASLVLTYGQLFGYKDLSVFGSVAAAESDSNIDFYDQDASSAMLGLIYQF